MEAVLSAWVASMMLGAIGLPLSFALLRRFPDVGSGFGFTAGSLAVSLLYFLLRCASVLPPGRGGFLLAAALAGAVSFAVARCVQWRRGELERMVGGAAIASCVFTGAFLAYTAFRSYNAEITGTEQPMDLLFLNAALVSPDYPPHDPWLSGEPVSYYYFGYIQAAMLTALAGVASTIGYNLALAFIFAATASGLVSVTWALARWALPRRTRKFAGLAPPLALALVLFAGSLTAVFEWAAAHEEYAPSIYRAVGLDYLLPCEPGEATNCYAGPTNPRTTAWYPTEYWFWWRGTRVIPGTITEFPFFSFLLGDLHPHLMALPLVTFAVAVAAAVWRGRRVLDWRTLGADPWRALGISAVFGALAFQNTWDVITFSALLGLAIVARNMRTLPPARALVAAAGWLAPAAAVAVVAYAPWWLTFSSQASGLYAYGGEGTRPAHAFLQFGLPATFGALGLLAFRLRRSSVGQAIAAAGWVAVIPFVGWVGLAAARDDLGGAAAARGLGGWLTVAALGLLAWALAALALALTSQRSSAAPSAALAGMGVLLLYGAELFLIRDVFFESVPRLNTVFKLTYQAWLLLGIAGSVAATGVAAGALAGNRRWSALSARIIAVPAALLLLAGLVYPLVAAFNRTEGFSRSTTIDGLTWLRNSDADEYALTRWVDRNVPPGAVILEATGRRWVRDASGSPSLVDSGVDYTEAGRIASRTGRQSPIGWYFHEVQWRGDSATNRAKFAARQNAVDDAYLTTTPSRVVEVMQQLGAEYLIVGSLERARYPESSLDYDAFLDRVFESGRYRVYRLPVYRPVSAP